MPRIIHYWIISYWYKTSQNKIFLDISIVRTFRIEVTFADMIKTNKSTNT